MKYNLLVSVFTLSFIFISVDSKMIDYFVNVNGVHCSMLSLQADISVLYNTKEGIKSANISFENTTNMQSGVCVTRSEYNTAQFNISIDKKDTLVFNFHKVDHKVFLKNIQFVFNLPNIKFPNALDKGTVIASTEMDLYLSNSSEYYQCMSKNTINLSKGVTFNVYAIKLKVFNVENNSFGDSLSQCPQDNSKNTKGMLTKPIKTTTRKPTPRKTTRKTTPRITTRKTTTRKTTPKKTTPRITTTRKTTTRKTTPKITTTRKTTPKITTTRKTTPKKTTTRKTTTRKTTPKITTTRKTTPKITTTRKTTPKITTRKTTPKITTRKTTPKITTTRKTTPKITTTRKTTSKKTTPRITTARKTTRNISTRSTRTILTTTTSPKDPKFVIKGKTICLLVQSKMTLSVSYETKKKNMTRSFTITSKTFYNGTCAKDKEKLDIYISDNIFFTLSFTKKGEKVKLNNFDTHIFLSPKFFPDAKHQNKTLISSTSLGSLYEVDVNKSYSCMKNLTFGNHPLKLDVLDFKFEAFRSSNTENFSKNVITCESSSHLKVWLIVVIIVVLLVIIIILFIIYRIYVKKKQGYEKL